jgi:hypothetical protein
MLVYWQHLHKSAILLSFDCVQNERRAREKDAAISPSPKRLALKAEGAKVVVGVKAR